MVRVPGTTDEEISWQVSNLGGREHFLIFASPERVTAFEDLFAALPRPVFGKPVSPRRADPDRDDLEAAECRRPDGRADGEDERQPGKRVQDSARRRPETANGLWVRQLTSTTLPANGNAGAAFTRAEAS